MPIMGSLGDKIVFSVSPEEVNALNNIKWSVGANFATHQRHLKEPLLEFTGSEVEQISFSLYFSAFLGVKPMNQVKEILFATRKGEPLPFYIGGKAYGTYRWVISKATIDLTTYDNKGNLVLAKVSVTLKSYSER